jgi:hypothetical protein
MDQFQTWKMSLQLGVISSPPAVIGKCPLTGVEAKVRNDRFVVDSGSGT